MSMIEGRRSYDGFYLIESSTKSIPIRKSIAVKPSVSGDTITWKNKDRKFIRIEEDIGFTKLYVYLPNDEVITLSKVPEEVYNKIIALNSSIDDYVDTLPFDTYDPANPIPSQEKKESYKAKVKKSFDEYGFDLKNHSKIARQLINQKCNSIVIKNDASSDEIQEIVRTNLDTIINLATHEYGEEHFPECLSLFTLLTDVEPDKFNLWHLKGIAAQACGNYSLALNAYSIALILNREHVEAHILSLECNLNLENEKAAVEDFRKAQQLIATMPPSERRDLLEGDLNRYAEYMNLNFTAP